MPEDNPVTKIKKKPEVSYHELRTQEMAQSDDPYLKFSWWIYQHCMVTDNFENFIMVNILLVAIATGLELEYGGLANILYI